MKIENHRLKLDNGKFCAFEKTENMGGTLVGGRPKVLVIHYTAGADAAGAIKTFKNTNTDKRTSAHLVVDHDGTITQMVPFDRVAWHAGPSRWRSVNGVNAISVGIEIANWGKLKKTAAGGWVSWTGASVPSSRVILEKHKHFPQDGDLGWEMFDPPQIEAVIGAAQAIVSHYGIGGWDFVGHEDIAPLRKIDPGPAIDMDILRARVFGREEDAFDDRLFKVDAPGDGLNLRENPSIADSRIIKKLPHGTIVHLIERVGLWALVAEVVGGNDDVTGFVHTNWLVPA